MFSAKEKITSLIQKWKEKSKILCDFKNWSFRGHILWCITRFENKTQSTCYTNNLPVYQLISNSTLMVKHKAKLLKNTFLKHEFDSIQLK